MLAFPQLAGKAKFTRQQVSWQLREPGAGCMGRGKRSVGSLSPWPLIRAPQHSVFPTGASNWQLGRAGEAGVPDKAQGPQGSEPQPRAPAEPSPRGWPARCTRKASSPVHGPGFRTGQLWVKSLPRFLSRSEQRGWVLGAAPPGVGTGEAHGGVWHWAWPELPALALSAC